jgi:hypothetical protein
MLEWRSFWLAIILAVFAFVADSASAIAACGLTADNVTGSPKFLATDFGTLAVRRGDSYAVLQRSACTDLRYTDRVHFVVNHHGNFESSQRAFMSIHMAMVRFQNPRNLIFLYRNQHERAGWLKDKTDLPFSTNRELPPTEFNSDLNGQQSDFDKKYRDSSGRVWNDEVPTTINNGSYKTWDTRHTFDFRNRLINSNQFGLQTQNYFISFYTSPRDFSSGGKEVDFNAQLAGAQCIFIRTSGSENLGQALNGDYLIAVNGDRRCDKLAYGFGSVGWLDFINWLLGISH